jgi:hypothetical protein
MQKWNIHNWNELKEALTKTLEKIELKKKSKDFEHLLFQQNSDKILLFKEFIDDTHFTPILNQFHPLAVRKNE